MSNKVIVLCQEQDREQLAKALKDKPVDFISEHEVEPHIWRIQSIRQAIAEKLNYYRRIAI